MERVPDSARRSTGRAPAKAILSAAGGAIDGGKVVIAGSGALALGKPLNAQPDFAPVRAFRLFRGGIPSIIATASADGMPNVSCLSHVLKVDDDHVAISNRFFAWTAANIRANPKVAPIPVDGFMGDKFLLDVAFVRPVDSGALYDRIARRLSASSALVGMSDIMKLRSADIFLVTDIAKSPPRLRPAHCCRSEVVQVRRIPFRAAANGRFPPKLLIRHFRPLATFAHSTANVCTEPILTCHSEGQIALVAMLFADRQGKQPAVFQRHTF
ncbi:pyridoxamine 5'-phosphate oxidase family protein [Seohaeicola zhoushanensis]